MTPDDTALRMLLSEAVDAADPTLRHRLRTEPAAYVDLVALTARARTETEVLLNLAVAGARSAGCTWVDIGDALGVPASTARRLHSPGDPAPGSAGTPSDTDAAPGERTQVLTRQTLFSEMRMLEHAGRYGWYLIGSGTATLIVRSSTEQWEHRRVFASRAKGRALVEQGWMKVGSSSLPWAYFKRPTGVPALPDPLDGSDLRAQ